MNYLVPLLTLSAVIALFFLLARNEFSLFVTGQFVLRVLVAMPLFFSGLVLHFLRAQDAAAIIPPLFPHPLLLVYISGLFEIAGAIALFTPRLRRTAGLLIAIMMVAIFPANIYAAGKTIGGLHMPGIPVRTTMQAIYILLVLLATYGWPRGWRITQPHP